MNSPRLIAIDWGTSNLRASLLGDDGTVLDTRAAASGVMAVPERRFADALLALCGDWIDDRRRCPLVAGGMIGSRQGWVEAPYLPCPATLADAARQLLPIDVRPGVVLHVVPGLRCAGSDGEYDVMRGEEPSSGARTRRAAACCRERTASGPGLRTMVPSNASRPT